MFTEVSSEFVASVLESAFLSASVEGSAVAFTPAVVVEPEDVEATSVAGSECGKS